MELWPFIPQASFDEVLQWKTDVIQAKAAEQRFSLRNAPREEFNFRFLLDSSQYSAAKMLARAYTATQVLMPIWGEFVEVVGIDAGQTSIAFDTTLGRFQAGDDFLVWSAWNKYEIRPAETMDAAGVTFTDPLNFNHPDALVIPLREAYFSRAPEFNRGANDWILCDCRFFAIDPHDVAASGRYPTFAGHDVITERPVVRGSVRDSTEKEADVFDSGSGVIWKGEKHTYATGSTQLRWETDTRAQLWALRQWLYTRRGRWRGFWIPSWNNDLRVTATVGTGQTTLRVADVGYLARESGERAVMIVDSNGALHFNRITGSLGGDGINETLTLSTAINSGLAAAGVASVSFLNFARFSGDSITINHQNAGQATISATAKEVPEP